MTEDNPASKVDQKVKQKAGKNPEARQRSLANLKPWQPGQPSANPGGRPKMDPEVRRILEAATPDAARRLAELVKSPDEKVSLAAIDQVFNRIYGRPTQQVDATVTTTNVQQAHLQILVELQQRREDAMKVIEANSESDDDHKTLLK